MADQLSGVAIIICIAFGILTVILLFIFAKRQIMRFTLKSRRGPHFPIGSGAPKVLRNEIDRRFSVIKTIAYEPKLLKKEEEDLFCISEASHISPPHLYRMKALDELSILEGDIAAADPSKARHAGHDLRAHLIRLMHAGLLLNAEPALIHRFVDLYEQARHEPVDFNHEQYSHYKELLCQLQHCISKPKMSPHHNNNTKSSPPSDLSKHLSNGKPAPILRHPPSVTIEAEDKKGENVTPEPSPPDEEER